MAQFLRLYSYANWVITSASPASPASRLMVKPSTLTTGITMVRDCETIWVVRASLP